MAEQNPPTFIQAGTHTAEDTRRFISAVTQRRPGIIASGDLLVAEKGTPNMSVDVAIGACIITGSQATFQGSYYCENRTLTNVIVTAAHATLARKDLIVAKVEDAAYSGGTNAWSLACVAGTAAGSPAEPAVPSNCITLAMIDIPAADTAIQNAQITDRRMSTSGQGRAVGLGGVQVATSSNRPSSAAEGAVIYETDTDRLKTYDGAAWNNASSYPLLFVYKTASESVTSSTVMQNDDHLFLSVVANAIYVVETMVIYDAGTTGDLEVGYTVPASALFHWTPRDVPVATVSGSEVAIDLQYLTTGTSSSGGIGSGTKIVVLHHGLLITGASAGTFRLQWAQTVSNGTATRLNIGSYMTAQRVA